MIKNFANVKTPTTGDNWIALNQNKKIDLVMNELRKDQNFKNFHVSEALDNG
jgi:hypothetical protein